MKIKWTRMYWIIVFCAIFHLVGTFVGLCVLYAAIYIFHSLGQHLNIVTSPGEGYILPIFLIIVGSTSFLLHFPQAIMVIRSMRRRHYKNLNICLNIMLCLHFVWSLIELLAASAIFLHSYNIYERMNDGLLETMNRYKNSTLAKYMIDEVQFQFQCCGSQSYKDWFSIGWYTETQVISLLENKSTVTDLLHDNVPFSCCSVSALCPCVHYGVTGGRREVDYAYTPDRNLSISTDGCHDALTKRAKTLAWLVSIAIVIYSAFQILTCIITRLVQTGHSSEWRFNRRNPSTCWLCGASSCRKKTRAQAKEIENSKNKVISRLEAKKSKSEATKSATDESTG